MNPILVAKLIKQLACKLGTIVVDDPSGDTKSVDDIVFDEVDHIIILTSMSGTTFTRFKK